MSLVKSPGGILVPAESANPRQARGKSDLVVRAFYEAASTKRRLSTWGTSSAGPNAATLCELATLRARSRELGRNNPNAKAARRAYVRNMIGTGIKARWGDEEVQELWEEWIQEADAYGQTTFHGLQALVAGTEFESGEAIARFRPRRLEDGLSVPLQVQVLEPDHLDESYSTGLPSGQVIHAGVEFDALGRRSAYHMFRSHPGDMLPLLRATDAIRTRVPAGEIMHIYEMLRPGQVRGVPAASAAIVRLYELDQGDDAELVRRKMAAMVAAFIKTSGEEISAFGKTEDDDTGGNKVVGWEPGMVSELPDGTDIRFSDTPDTGNNYQPWITYNLRAIAAGYGITYEQLTGDLSQLNFTSLRMGLQEFRREMEMRQASMIIFQFCRRTAVRWLNMAVIAGYIRRTPAEIRKLIRKLEWRPQGWAYIDPVKDRLAEQMDMRNGTDSRQSIIARRGRDAEKVDQEIVEDNARADEKGLVFDSDPRNTAKSGIIQIGDGEDGQNMSAQMHYAPTQGSGKSTHPEVSTHLQNSKQEGKPTYNLNVSMEPAQFHATVNMPESKPEIKVQNLECPAPVVHVENIVETPEVHVSNNVQTPDVRVEAPNVSVQPADVHVLNQVETPEVNVTVERAPIDKRVSVRRENGKLVGEIREQAR